MHEVWMSVVTGFILIISGLFCVCIPNRIFSLILNLSVIYFLINTVYLLYLFSKKRKKIDLLFAFLSLLFVLFLMEYRQFPEWIIRVMFATYCLLIGISCTVQVGIHYINGMKGSFFFLLLGIVYIGLGLFLLWSNMVTTDRLLQFFGLYFMILGVQYLHDSWQSVQPEKKYRWKRSFRIMIPPIFAVFIPDRVIQGINAYLQEGKTIDLSEYKSDQEPQLKVMVHVGPDGFQKIGHICFAYKDLVYSYGNYDAQSFHLMQTLGDGVFFNVELNQYIANAMRAENNSIFEYGIYLEPKEQALVERELRKLQANSYRWYCELEKTGDYDHFYQYAQDYPCRLHYRTGAKFYKIKQGKFKTYWVCGDNCASFIDWILGQLGSDVLSIRGIITPGSYFEFLETEYMKKSSPVVYRKVHPWNKELAKMYTGSYKKKRFKTS